MNQVVSAKTLSPPIFYRKSTRFDFSHSLPSKLLPDDKSFVSATFYAEDARWLQLSQLPAPGIVDIFAQFSFQLFYCFTSNVAFNIEGITAA